MIHEICGNSVKIRCLVNEGFVRHRVFLIFQSNPIHAFGITKLPVIFILRNEENSFY